eukprot:378637_1
MSQKAPLPKPKVKVGDSVKLQRGKTGIVLFIGSTTFSNGKELIGIKLDRYDPSGNDGKGYFTVQKGRGYFTDKQNISLILLQVNTPNKENANKITELKNKLRQIDILEWKRKNGVLLQPTQLSKISKRQQYERELYQWKISKTHAYSTIQRKNKLKLPIPCTSNPRWKDYMPIIAQLGFQKATIIDRNNFETLASTSSEHVASAYFVETTKSYPNYNSGNKTVTKLAACIYDDILINENQELLDDWSLKDTFTFYRQKFKILIRSTDHDMY